MSEFVIHTNSDVPIYRQLVEQVRRAAASGRLLPGERLPSVRTLAEQLAVNPMTVSKAYNLLEQEGVLYRQRGIGMVLQDDSGSRGELINPAVHELVSQAKQLGYEKATILELISGSWEKDK
jgi:GntR family transcriptional regulator